MSVALKSRRNAMLRLRFAPLALLSLVVQTTAPPPPTPTPIPNPRAGYDPSYPDVCIPPPPPDLDCGDIPYRNSRVVGGDPHRFDRDRDGIGCES